MNAFQSHLYCVFCAVGLLLGGCGSATVETPATPTDQEIPAEAGPVTIFIQTGEDKQEVEVPNVLPGATVESVMRSVTDVPITINGSGMSAFVTSIDGVETGSTEGWTYTVNGEFAKQGIGSTMIVPPATLTWTYGSYTKTNTEEVAEDAEVAENADDEK